MTPCFGLLGVALANFDTWLGSNDVLTPYALSSMLVVNVETSLLTQHSRVSSIGVAAASDDSRDWFGSVRGKSKVYTLTPRQRRLVPRERAQVRAVFASFSCRISEVIYAWGDLSGR